MIRLRDINVNTPDFWDWTWDNEAPWGPSFGPPVERYETVAAALTPGMTVLDVGGGRGEFLRWLGDGYGRVLADHSPYAVAYATEGGWVDRAVVADACDLPFADGEFDAVVCQEVIEHVDSPADLAAELLRVARQTVVVTTPDWIDKNERQHVWSLDTDDLRDLFGESIEVRSAGQALIATVTK